MLTAVGKQRLVMYDNILVAGINVVLNLLLILEILLSRGGYCDYFELLHHEWHISHLRPP